MKANASDEGGSIEGRLEGERMGEVYMRASAPAILGEVQPNISPGDKGRACGISTV